MPVLSTNRCLGTGLAYRLDARTKMGVSLLASLAVMVLGRPEALLLLLLASLAYALTLHRPRALLLCHGCLVAMWVVAYGFLLLIDLFMPGAGTGGPGKLLVPFLRTAVMVNVILVMALSIRIQAVLSTLTSLRLHRCIAIPTAVMIRFIPVFLSDIRQVVETLKIRGQVLSPRFFLRHPLLAARLLLVPLIFRALRAADEIGIAAELKGLGYAWQIRPCRPLRLARRDWIVSGSALLCVAAGFLLQGMVGWSGGGMF